MTNKAFVLALCLIPAICLARYRAVPEETLSLREASAINSNFNAIDNFLLNVVRKDIAQEIRGDKSFLDKVGIGTTSPDTGLDLTDTSGNPFIISLQSESAAPVAINHQIKVLRSGTSTYLLVFNDGNGTAANSYMSMQDVAGNNIYQWPSSGNFVFRDSATGATKFQKDSNHNFQFHSNSAGTFTPRAAVDILGNTNTAYTFVASVSDSNYDLVVTTNGTVGMGETSPLGTVHVKTSDAGGGTINTGADDFVVESNGSGGMTILTPNTATARMTFADTAGNEQGGLQYLHADDVLRLLAGTGIGLEVESDLDVHVHPSGTADVDLEVSNGSTTGGGTIHRAASGTHSEMNRKDRIVYLPVQAESSAVDDIKSMRHAKFKYKRINRLTGAFEPSKEEDQTYIGMMYEEAPDSIKGDNGDIIIDKRIALLEMAIKELVREIEVLKSRGQP